MKYYVKDLATLKTRGYLVASFRLISNLLKINDESCKTRDLMFSNLQVE